MTAATSRRAAGATAVADRERLLALVERFASRRVAVIGDFIADEFIYGRVARVSREAPVLILEYDRTLVVPGGAGNAANNVAALGARTRAIGLVGRDDPGDRLVAALDPRVEPRGLVRSREHQTPTKTRILAGGVHSAKQQVVRIDRGTRRAASRSERAAFARAALARVGRVDAVLVSDYGAGLVTPALVGEITRAVRGAARRPDVPVLVDSRYDLGRYRRLTACTPNESEVEALLGVTIDDDPRVLERAGREMLARTGMRIVLITRGSRGMALFEVDQPTRHIAIYGSDEIADVTGAGDTVIATMTLALAAGAAALDAAHLANYAGGLVVMKRGTATVSADELSRAIAEDQR
jgi:D-glycero-beta-D-manno-heptose-7-phosphate kinase